MVLITCKKCNSNIDMPNKRYKICTNCNIKTIIKKKSIITENTLEFNILNIFYLIPEICSYLTLYEIWNTYQTCTEFKDILSDQKIWFNILKRDYGNISLFINNKLIEPRRYSLLIESCMICPICKVYLDKCNTHCLLRFNKISKTDCLNYYKLELNELLKFPCEIKYNNFFKKNITLYKKNTILNYVTIKYKGWTNFLLFRKNIEHKLHLKKIKIMTNRENKIKDFQNWKQSYINSINYSKLSNIERQNLLDLELEKQNMERREDSLLCKGFINGTVNNKSVDHIVAILKITSYLFTYSHFIYTNFSDICNNNLEQLMFNNRNKKKQYTWYDAVKDTCDKYRNKCIEYNYHYINFNY